MNTFSLEGKTFVQVKVQGLPNFSLYFMSEDQLFSAHSNRILK